MRFGTGFDQMNVICFSQDTLATFNRWRGYLYNQPILSFLRDSVYHKLLKSVLFPVITKIKVSSFFLKRGVYIHRRKTANITEIIWAQ